MENNNEIYKQIEGYINVEISNFGFVRNMKTHEIRNTTIDKDGFLIVGLPDKNKHCIRKKIHWLIAKVFIENPENKQFVIHLDNNKLNNDISNLQWMTGDEINKETYKKIEGFDTYEISNFGNIRNINTLKLRNTYTDKQGFLIVSLHENKKTNTRRLQVLIAKAFIENPENKTCVSHIDSNKLNNTIYNLKWQTIDEISSKVTSKRVDEKLLIFQKELTFRGVSYDETRTNNNSKIPCWLVQIYKNGKNFNVDYCYTFEEAINRRISEELKQISDINEIHNLEVDKERFLWDYAVKRTEIVINDAKTNFW